jgi:hypothetical protein
MLLDFAKVVLTSAWKSNWHRHGGRCDLRNAVQAACAESWIWTCHETRAAAGAAEAPPDSSKSKCRGELEQCPILQPCAGRLPPLLPLHRRHLTDTAAAPVRRPLTASGRNESSWRR